MKKRKLGNSGLEIAPLALGGNVFGWAADEPTSFRPPDAVRQDGYSRTHRTESPLKPGRFSLISQIAISKPGRRGGRRLGPSGRDYHLKKRTTEKPISCAPAAMIRSAVARIEASISRAMTRCIASSVRNGTSGRVAMRFTAPAAVVVGMG